MANKLKISMGSVETLIKRLQYSKVSARWVPRLLMLEHKEKRLVAARQLLKRYEQNRVNFLESTTLLRSPNGQASNVDIQVFGWKEISVQ